MEVRITKTKRTITVVLDKPLIGKFAASDRRFQVYYDPKKRQISLRREAGGLLAVTSGNTQNAYISFHNKPSMRSLWSLWPNHGRIQVEDQTKIDNFVKSGILEITLPKDLPAPPVIRPYKRGKGRQIIRRPSLAQSINLIIQLEDQTTSFEVPPNELLAIAMDLVKKGYVV